MGAVMHSSRSAPTKVVVFQWPWSNGRLADAGLESVRRGGAHFEPEAAEDTAKAHLHIMELGLHQFPRCQHRPNLLRRQRFAMNRPKPAQPHQLCDASGILLVGLDRHGLEGVTHGACLKQFNSETGLDHASIQPLRRRPGLQADPGQRQTKT